MTNLWKVIAAVALLVSLVAAFEVWSVSHPTVSFGALGPKYAEQYDPYLKYNGGYNSALPIQTTSSVTAGSISVPTSNTATSTLAAGCIQFNATSSTAVGHLAVGTSYISTSTFQGTVIGYPVFWAAGACPF